MWTKEPENLKNQTQKIEATATPKLMDSDKTSIQLVRC